MFLAGGDRGAKIGRRHRIDTAKKGSSSALPGGRRRMSDLAESGRSGRVQRKCLSFAQTQDMSRSILLTSKSKYSEYTVGRNAISLRNGDTLKASLVARRRTAPNIPNVSRETRVPGQGAISVKIWVANLFGHSARPISIAVLSSRTVSSGARVHQHSATVQNRPYVLCGSPFSSACSAPEGSVPPAAK